MSELMFKPWYRWLMLAMFSLVCFLMSVCQFQPAFFAQDIMTDFGLSTSEFTWMTAAPMMVGLCLSIPAGSLCDKLGLRKTLALAMVISTAGAIARAFCANYALLLISSTVIGFSATVTAVSMAKLAMAWFPPKQISLAVGLMSAIGAAGTAFAQAVMGILFPDYTSAFLWGGLVLVAMTVVWAVFARDKALLPDEFDEDDAPQAPKKGFKDVVKCKGIWFAGFGGAAYNGFNVTAGSLLITALVVTWGTDPVLAGVIASLFSIGIVAGASVIPAVTCRLRFAKPICILLPIVSIGIFFLAWNINIDAVRCVLFAISGFFFGGISPTFVSYPSVLPEIDNTNSGAAGGLMISIMMIGAVTIPTFIITPIAGTDYNLMIIIACCITLISSVMFALLPSVYRSSDKDVEEAKKD